jgi:hypothetical protein
MLADLSKAVYSAFVAANFNQCLQALDRLNERCGPSGYEARYRKLCTEYLATGAPPDFDGRIVLELK